MLKHSIFSLGTIAIGGVAFVLLRDHAVKVALAAGALALLAPILWLLVSSLRPALPDRTCPRCGEEALRLLKPGEKTGVRCTACKLEDPELYVPFLIDVDDDLG